MFFQNGEHAGELGEDEDAAVFFEEFWEEFVEQVIGFGGGGDVLGGVEFE